MRNAFIRSLTEIASGRPDIWLLCGDLGFSVLEGFAEKYPSQYVNAGVAEQNMTGVAAGLALSGKTVFTYSIANFPTFRCLEQIRTDVCYHNLNVKIVSVGGGFAYGSAGYTHHGLEDIAVMRVLPHMTVFAPNDPVEAGLATAACVETPGPCYLRLGKGGEKAIHPDPKIVNVRKAIAMAEGSDVTILASAGTLGIALEATHSLKARNIGVDLLSLPCLQPLDFESISASVRKTGVAVTLEAHGIGGLGSIVAEFIALSGIRTRFHPLRLEGAPTKTAGDPMLLSKSRGLSVENTVDTVVSLLSQARRQTSGEVV